MLSDEIKQQIEEARKEQDEMHKEDRNSKYWEKNPNCLKYYGLAAVETEEDYERYLESQKVEFIFPRKREEHGLVRTDGMIGMLDPIPDADWPIRKGGRSLIFKK